MRADREPTQRLEGELANGGAPIVQRHHRFGDHDSKGIAWDEFARVTQSMEDSPPVIPFLWDRSQGQHMAVTHYKRSAGVEAGEETRIHELTARIEALKA
jgi:hypothetical protein